METNIMSRNQCDDTCDCGHQMTLKDAVSRPMSFDDYLKECGHSSPYRLEYKRLICSLAICPNCDRWWLMWIHMEHYSNFTNRWEKHCPLPDLSYYHTFDDETCYDKTCTMCYGKDAQ